VRHTDRDGDAPRDEGLPASVRSHDAQGRGDGEQGAGADGPFPRHGREALAGDQPGREDPHEGGGDLEWVAGNLVYAVGGSMSVRACIRQTAGGDQRSVELVDEGADHGSDGGANDLPPELGFGRGTEEMARLEVLHEVSRLEGALFLSVCCCSLLRVETHTASDYSRRFVSKLIADSYDEKYVPPRQQPS